MKKRKILKKVLFKNWKHLPDLIGQIFQQYSRTNSLKKIRSIVKLWCCMYHVYLVWGKEISRKIFRVQCTPILTSRGSAPTHVSPQAMPNWHKTYRRPAGISDLSRISFPEEKIEPIGHVSRCRRMHVEMSSSSSSPLLFSFYFAICTAGVLLHWHSQNSEEILIFLMTFFEISRHYKYHS